MIIQELYFQNYYNLGNPNRNPRKNKMPNFPGWPNATYGLLHFFYPFLENPVSQIIIIQELYFQNYHNLGNPYK